MGRYEFSLAGPCEALLPLFMHIHHAWVCSAAAIILVNAACERYYSPCLGKMGAIDGMHVVRLGRAAFFLNKGHGFSHGDWSASSAIPRSVKGFSGNGMALYFLSPLEF